MRPMDYANCYLNLYHYTRDDTPVRIGVRNYLQSGKGQQSTNALAMQAKLFRAIAASRGLKYPVPERFDIFQYDYLRTTLERVFIGKGAPDEIQDALWLMDRLEITDAGGVNSLCDKYLGVDCGGFVANYWGMGRPGGGNARPPGWSGFTPRMFWDAGPSRRRKRKADIRQGDAVIFFTFVKDDNPNLKATALGGGKFDTSTGSKAEHIALTDGWEPVLDPDSVSLWITESSGAARSDGNNGVNTRSETYKVKESGGYVYCLNAAGTTRMYFLAPPTSPTSYLPWGVAE